MTKEELLPCPLSFKAESEAFEEYAKENKFNMSQHPLHYLFLERETDHARHVWKAAIDYAKRNTRADKPTCEPTVAEGMLEGMADALAYAQGDKSKGREYIIEPTCANNARVQSHEKPINNKVLDDTEESQSCEDAIAALAKLSQYASMELTIITAKRLEETIRKALAQPQAVDVEGLKYGGICTFIGNRGFLKGWNACIDHLVEKGLLKDV